MDFKAAIAKLKTLEVDGVADLVSAIEAEVSRLETKNFDVIGEKRNASQKAQAMEQALKAIAKTVGVEGDTEAILSGTEAKVQELATKAKTLETEKTALETRATTAEGKVKDFERDTKFTEFATVAGANSAVLKRLLSSRFDELKIEGEGDQRIVKLGDKTLKEAIAADEGLKPFESALFPSTTTDSTKKTEKKLPSGSPNGKQEESPDPVKGYTSRAYGGIKAFAKTGESSN